MTNRRQPFIIKFLLRPRIFLGRSASVVGTWPGVTGVLGIRNAGAGLSVRVLNLIVSK